MIRKVLLPVLILAFTVQVYAQDWPQYLGPDRNSISPQENILRSWPENGPEVEWSLDLGIGYGGPVVKNGKVYLLDRDNEVGDIMRCFDLTSGEELWKYQYDAPGEVMFPGSRSVPVVNDSHVYSCGPYGDLYCIDINTHQPVWNKNVWKDFGGQDIPTWAISQCPLIYSNLLILASQAPEAGVVAYDKQSGKLIWKTPSLGAVGYVSPSIVKIDNEDHVVMVTASARRGGQMGNVVGIDPDNGDILWKYDNWNCHIPVPSAVDAGNNEVLITGGYELGATMIRVLKHANGDYATEEIFTTKEFGTHTKPPIFYRDYFYGQYGTNSRRDGLVCMSRDGKIIWKTKRDPDFNKGSMILADGLILATDGSNLLYLIEPDPNGFKMIAHSELLGSMTTSDEDSIPTRTAGSTQNWAPIALADGKLLIRDQRMMLCIKIAEK